jgi:hypothetical protein
LFINGTKKSTWQAQDNFGTILYSYDNEPLIFSTSSSNGFSEKFRIDTDGKLLRGWQSTAFSGTGQSSDIAIAGTSSNNGLQVIRYNTSFGAYGLTIGRSKNGTIGTHGQVLSGNDIGFVSFVASDGANWRGCADIAANADGNITSTSAEGKLIFKTTKSGSTTPTQAMTIKANHNVEIHDGNLVFETAGTGIDFSAATPDASGSSTNDSEVLDDYEEGDWVPAAFNGANGATTNSTSGREARYVKVGRLVHVSCYIQVDKGTNTAQNYEIYGLPFTPASTQGLHSGLSVGYIENWTTQVSMPQATVQPNSTRILIRAIEGTSATTSTTMNANNLGGTSEIIIGGTYYTLD